MTNTELYETLKAIADIKAKMIKAVDNNDFTTYYKLDKEYVKLNNSIR